jgi:hypothetical protein
MRTFLLLIPILALAGGCASGPTPASYHPAGRGPGLSERDRADPAGALRRAGAGDALTPDGAQALFGRADIERRDGAGALLTWRTRTCAIALAFAVDARGDLRLGAADIAARDQRAPAPSLDQCVREALARRATS